MNSNEAPRKLRRTTQCGSPSQLNGSEGGARSYKDKLIGEIPGAYEQAFGFKSIMDEGVESDDETADLNAGRQLICLVKGNLKCEINGQKL